MKDINDTIIILPDGTRTTFGEFMYYNRRNPYFVFVIFAYKLVRGFGPLAPIIIIVGNPELKEWTYPYVVALLKRCEWFAGVVFDTLNYYGFEPSLKLFVGIVAAWLFYKYSLRSMYSAFGYLFTEIRKAMPRRKPNQ